MVQTQQLLTQIQLDSVSGVPLAHQIAQRIRWAVATGELRPGEQLPPTRAAANSWGVHRHTVARAYQLLIESGLLNGKPPKRFIVAETARRHEDSAASHRDQADFLDNLISEANAVHGLTPADLARAIEARAAGEPRRHLSVVECTPSQCEDLCEQLRLRWNLQGVPFRLDQRGEPPPGPIIVPLFHYEEVRERWWQRRSDIFYVATDVDPAVALVVRQLLKGGVLKSVVVLAAHDAVGADRLRQKLTQLVSDEDVAWEIEILRERASGGLKAGPLYVCTPAAWERIPIKERESPHIVRVRYLIDSNDLERLPSLMPSYFQRRAERIG